MVFLSVNQYLCTFFHQKLTIALLESAKGREYDRRKYFMINSHERILLNPVGIEPMTWSPVRCASNWAIEIGPSDMCPTQIQISLHICAIWSESSLGTFWIAKDAKFQEDNGDWSDCTGTCTQADQRICYPTLWLKCQGRNKRKQPKYYNICGQGPAQPVQSCGPISAFVVCLHDHIQ